MKTKNFQQQQAQNGANDLLEWAVCEYGSQEQEHKSKSPLFHRYIVLGDDMYPRYERGDMLILNKRDNKKIIPGLPYVVNTARYGVLFRRLKYESLISNTLVAYTNNEEEWPSLKFEERDIIDLYDISALFRQSF